VQILKHRRTRATQRYCASQTVAASGVMSSCPPGCGCGGTCVGPVHCFFVCQREYSPRTRLDARSTVHPEHESDPRSFAAWCGIQLDRDDIETGSRRHVPPVPTSSGHIPGLQLSSCLQMHLASLSLQDLVVIANGFRRSKTCRSVSEPASCPVFCMCDARRRVRG
jgi:hypothetical protein